MITIGGAPFSTLKEFDENSRLEETVGTWDKSITDHLKRLVQAYDYLSSLYQVGLDVTDEKMMLFLMISLQQLKREAQKTIWMLTGRAWASSRL